MVTKRSECDSSGRLTANSERTEQKPEGTNPGDQQLWQEVCLLMMELYLDLGRL